MKTELILVGGGHSHVQVLKNLMMEPLSNTRLTLVVDKPVAIYSGMIPGWIAGEYPRFALEIDLRPLCTQAGARLIEAKVLGIDPEKCRILLEERPGLPFDIASVDIGSTVAGLELPSVKSCSVATRPIGSLLDRLNQALSQLKHAPKVVVVGGGAAGIEVAFCLKQRLLKEGRSPEITILHRGMDILPEQPALRARVYAAAKRHQLLIRPQSTVIGLEPGSVLLEQERLPSDLTLWVTGAAPHPFEGPFKRDNAGFLSVDPSLRLLDYQNLFAVGDCAHFQKNPLPKAGVYAVRQGPILSQNLKALTTGNPLQPYKPQRDFLALLNLGDGTAIGGKWGASFEGSWVWRWKDRIDRRFMKMFQLLDEDGTPLVPVMAMEEPCRGCAAKVPQDELQSTLQGLAPQPPDASVVLGMGEAEDVAAVKVGHSTLAWNTDVFTAFSDDPYLTGKVAVWHSLSDLLAKNSRGRWAMAMVGLPESEPISSLEQLMAGMRFVLDQEGITLVGGHTWKGDLLTVGLTILGDAEKLIRMDGLKPGDRLILTRPLGTGVLLRAMMLGIARSCWLEPMLLGLQEGNRKALEQVRASAHAITDVTGFGLLGHLAGMLRASNVSARIIQSQVPRWPGVDGLVKRGVLSTAHPQNARIARYFTGELDPVLVDPQTGGGLLVGGVDVPGVVIGEVMEKREDGMLGELV